MGLLGIYVVVVVVVVFTVVVNSVGIVFLCFRFLCLLVICFGLVPCTGLLRFLLVWFGDLRWVGVDLV